MMPKLDGMSATRNIRQYDPLTPIISMTSNTTDQDIQQYIMSGMTDVLPKPLNQGTLGNLLERYCAHLVIQRHQQQQIHLLQQNYSLNGSLIELNMTPQLTLLEEDEDDVKGKGKEPVDVNRNNIEYLAPFTNNNNSNSNNSCSSSNSSNSTNSNQLMYTPQPIPIIPSSQSLPYMSTQPISNQTWFLYQKHGSS